MLMQEKGLNSANLAEIGGVQPSTISHFMSDRNKPGYELLSNVLSYYKDINARWLLLGEGEMYNHEVKCDSNKKTNPTLFEPSKQMLQAANELADTNKKTAIDCVPHNTSANTVVTVEKVILIYSDGTFEEIKHK